MYARGMAGLGAGCEEQYPPSITFSQSMECAFLPYSATCKALKRRGQLECEMMAAPPPVAVKPPAGSDQTSHSPSGGYIPGEPGAIIDEQIGGAHQSTLDRLRDFFTVQADQQQVLPCAGLFDVRNETTGECEIATALPLVAVGIAAVAAFSLIKGR